MLEMHNRRFIQNAKFVAYLSYFPENERQAVRESFQIYLSSVQAFMMLLDNKVGLSKNLPQPILSEEKNTQNSDQAIESLMEGQKQLPITSVENIARGRAIRLYNYLNDAKTFWWSIPSVYSDPAYPYREFFVD
jgi:hypothetical protein